MTSKLIKALQEATEPTWADHVEEWFPSGGGDYGRTITGKPFVVPVVGDYEYKVFPEVSQDTDPRPAFLNIRVQGGCTTGDDEVSHAIVDDLSPAEARALAAALIAGADLLDQYASEESS